MKRLVCWLTLVATALFGAGAAAAQDYGTGFGVDEFRGGLFFHSVDHAPPGSFLGFLDTTRLHDANVELLFNPFDLGDFNWIGEIRPHLGATVNFGGLESQVYAGLSWTWHVFDGPVFIEGTFGGALHNGATSGAIYPARNLGCSALFRESASIGFDITEQASIMATVEHSSHAGLCGAGNMGITNLGVRAGWKF
ncbi:MAG: acyloxyacyl hydrolase [Devosia sp.]